MVVLGVTPELRDLLAERRLQATLVDPSEAMHAATRRLLRNASNTDETWIRADWCESGIAFGSVDLVIGDMIWWGLPVGRQADVRDAIHALLRPAGLFVGRVRFTDTGRAVQDPVVAVSRYLHRLDRSPAERAILKGALLSWIYDHTENRGCLRLDRLRARELLLALADWTKVDDHRAFLLEASESIVGANWTSQSRAELLRLLHPRFRIIREQNADDYESSMYPVLALRPQ